MVDFRILVFLGWVCDVAFVICVKLVDIFPILVIFQYFVNCTMDRLGKCYMCNNVRIQS